MRIWSHVENHNISAIWSSNPFHDQLNVMSSHLTSTRLGIEERKSQHQKYLAAIISKVHAVKFTKKRSKLTRKALKSQQDCSEWLYSEHKQLQQYEDQGMFGQPSPIPQDAFFLTFHINIYCKILWN